MTEPLTCDIFYDYACPYVHAASVWVRHLEAALGETVQVNWRYFPLEQVNSAEGPEWKLWETGPEHKSRTRESMAGAIAARRQGEEAFQRFHYALLDLKHDDGKDHGKKATLLEAARIAGLDITAFEADLDDPGLLSAIGTDYEYARNELGVFGTPTFVFPDRSAAYIKMLPAPDAAESLVLWEDFVHTVTSRPYLREIKRPTPPDND